MMEYFWRQQDDIPEGMGYPLFGAAHILSVAITLILVYVFAWYVYRMEERRQRAVLKAIPLLMAAMEVFKILFLIRVHRFGIGYLPLHICSIGIFVFLLREYLPGRLAGEIFGEIALILIMPASAAALLFADWTVYYPVWNFMNIYSYIWHGLLILYPVVTYRAKEISPSIRHIHYVILFLCAVVPAIYAFDRHFGCNYFFVNWPVPGTPLSWLASFMGVPGYLIGYAILVLVFVLMMYPMLYLIKRTSRKPA